ncbi:hypothetical protein [Rugamonas sp. DEMB1]|uniref:hypothetical protein n=1 Tax=Rugamonas sp. DEMB1 TaxID=3039386 RepID=UPI00244C0467|nr:hypothetical protein [Rugamonas sp. DEMB1]WGG48479.1 hypothetical protein QC826_17445 [Rugamonas sp. DEMB1]
MAKNSNKKTPVRAALNDDSSLLASVKNGLGAVENSHRNYIEEGIKNLFSDSLELDEAMRIGNERDNRWDYLLGHKDTNKIRFYAVSSGN